MEVKNNPTRFLNITIDNIFCIKIQRCVNNQYLKKSIKGEAKKMFGKQFYKINNYYTYNHCLLLDLKKTKLSK